MPDISNITGFRAPTGHHGPQLEEIAVRLPATPWLSPERVAEARRVWSKVYGRVISEDEAVEILRNVHRLAAVMLRVAEENQKS